MVAANLNKMVEKNADLLECERGEIYVGNVLEMKKWAGRADDIGCTPSSTGLLCKPVLKVQHRPHLRSRFGGKPFSTGLCNEPVLKSPHEPVLDAWVSEPVLVQPLVPVCKKTGTKGQIGQQPLARFPLVLQLNVPWLHQAMLG